MPPGCCRGSGRGRRRRSRATEKQHRRCRRRECDGSASHHDPRPAPAPGRKVLVGVERGRRLTARCAGRWRVRIGWRQRTEGRDHPQSGNGLRRRERRQCTWWDAEALDRLASIRELIAERSRDPRRHVAARSEAPGHERRFAQRLFHVLSAREAPGCLALQCTQTRAIQSGGGHQTDGARRRDLQGQDVAQRGGVGVRKEQAAARDRAPEHRARREQVGAAVHARRADLLRRHEGYLAFDLPWPSAHDARLCPRDPEVGDARHAVGAHHDVLWRHVAMHQVHRLAVVVGERVRGVQPGEHVDHDGQDQA